ncbi:MAG: TonB-dependent receptor [Gemmatimonadota bacterium]|nr:TonB-dependent receptor [Gemmatimonadota bacterium]
MRCVLAITPRWLLGLSMAMVLPSFAAAQDGTITGTVRDDATNQALAGAQVFIPALAVGTLSDNEGAFVVQGVPAGTHVVEIQLIGYAIARQEVTVVAGSESPLDVALSEEALILGGITVIGTRARPRTVTESAVPIDVIPAAEIVNRGDVDFANVLRNVVPSFNVNTQPISDAATFSRPANLRGLSPDQTLVLVNGKRRHRSAVIVWYGNSIADGAQGPDISLFPSIALEQAEVLRDGAAAQYGSDAIAGVMNFVLKNDGSGGSIELKTGGHLLAETTELLEGGLFPGDGDMYTLSGNFGLPLGESGFLNLTGEYGNSDPTDRSVQRNDAAKLIASGNRDVRTPAQIWGSPTVSNDLKLWANSAYVFNDNLSFYGHGNYASKQVEGGFYFRNPNTRSGVFNTGSGHLLVGDLTDAQDGVLDGSAGCPEVRVVDGLVADMAALEEVLANPNCFTFQKMFPGGFTPQFGSYVSDASVVAGLRGTSGRLSWDASAAVGNSSLDFYMYNTVNASLGPDQPCSDKGTSPAVPDQPCTPYFNPGIYDQLETNFNVDLSYAVNDQVNIAGGAEWRNERFEIVQGDAPSWTEGPLASQGFTPGSNGFTGFGPLTAGIWNRSNFAGYGDLELREPDGAWTLGIAGRVERFSDFGTTVNGKVAGRVSLSEGFALRGAASTGFRAPTPGQQNAFNISTIYDPALKDLTNNGTIPSTSALAQQYGGEPLEPEKSVNLSFGSVFQRGNFSLSADYFLIDVSQRLTTSRNINLTNDEIQRLVQDGIIRPGGVLKRFQFFVNDFSTRTQGLDVVAAYDVENDRGVTTVSTAWNVTSTNVTEHNPETLNDSRVNALEKGLPSTRGSVTVNHVFPSGTRLLVRGSHWDGVFERFAPYSGNPDVTTRYPGRQLLDFEFAQTFADRWTLTVGGQNALNTYPGEFPDAANDSGQRYGEYSPFGFNGAFYYTKLSYSW